MEAHDVVVIGSDEEEEQEEEEEECSAIGGHLPVSSTSPTSVFGCTVLPGLSGRMWYCLDSQHLTGYLRQRGADCFRACLQKSDLERLHDYEWNTAFPEGKRRKSDRAAGESSSVKSRIWDLKQTAAFAGRGSHYLPTLLVRCDAVWSSSADRFLLPMEALMSQGLPLVPSVSQTGHDLPPLPFPPARLASISEADVYKAAGNGLNLACTGAVLMWALCTHVPSEIAKA